MELERNYLTSAEIKELVSTLTEEKDATNRQILKDGILCQLLFKDLPKLDTCDDYYDYYVKSEINFEEDVKNYKIVDKLVNEKIGTVNILENFLNELNTKLDSFKIEDFSKQFEELKGVLDNHAEIV